MIVSVLYRTVPMYISDIYQNDRDEKLDQKKFTLTITLTVTRQERNFHCITYTLRIHANSPQFCDASILSTKN